MCSSDLGPAHEQILCLATCMVPRHGVKKVPEPQLDAVRTAGQPVDLVGDVLRCPREGALLRLWRAWHPYDRLRLWGALPLPGPLGLWGRFSR